MKRIQLLAAMTILAAAMAFAVVLGSPYAPVIEPCIDIEEIWRIEDARTESEEPLVSALENKGMPLAYDAASNTFYCTLGRGLTGDWPDLHLTAPGASDTKLVFADDYQYDWCDEAVREGYRYAILAYNDDEFSYADIVFTGLPLVMIHTDEEIGDMDVTAKVAVSCAKEEPVISAGRVHLRGKGSRNEEKKNMKVEFTRSEGGKKTLVNLPGFGAMDEILLNPMVFDTLLIREKLSWEIYGEMLGEEYAGGFEERKTAYAEVFLNDAYYGVYLMAESMDEEKEISKRGDSHLLTDSVYRTIPRKFAGERPYIAKHEGSGAGFEVRYEPAGQQMFAAMDAYRDLLMETSDEEFIRKAETCMDIESVVRYALLTQAAGLTDNASNNVYIWVRRSSERVQYQFIPWDMDMSWGRAQGDVSRHLGDNYDAWRAFDIVDRIIALNVGGALDLMVERWDAWREDIFTTEYVMELIQGYFMELSESGAVIRNAERWGIDANTEGYEIIDFSDIRFAALDKAMDLVRNRNGEIPAFLKRIDEDLNAYPLFSE